VLRFNPWNFSGDTKLLEQFFQFLAIEISARDTSPSIKKAADALELLSLATSPFGSIPVVGILPKLLGFGAERLKKHIERRGQLDKVKETVSDALAAQPRKIVVVMDDIDRLSKGEIRKVFQLVKACGDFKNVIYVLAFDKAVVANALAGVQGGNGEAYLEKMVNVPFQIPALSAGQLDILLRQTIEEFSSRDPKYNWKSKRLNDIVSVVASLFDTIRQVDRFANVLRVSEPFLRREVDYADLIALSAVQLVSEPLYRFIGENPDLFIDHFLNMYLRGEKVDGVERDRIEAVFSSETVRKKAEIMGLLKLLFPKLTRLFDGASQRQWSNIEWRRQRRACSDLMTFVSYFQLSLPESDISVAELDEVLDQASAVQHLDGAIRHFESRNLVARLLLRLSELEWSAFAEDVKAILVQTILIHGDEYVALHKSSDIFLEVIGLLEAVLRGMEVRSRFEAVCGGIHQAQSLFIPAALVSLEDQRRNRFLDTNGGGRSNPGDPESNPLFSGEQLDVLESKAGRLLAKAADDGRMLDSSRMIFLLARWEEWGERAEILEFVDRQLTSVSRFLGFLARFLDRFNPRAILGIGPAFYADTLTRFVDARTIIEKFDALRNNLDMVTYDDEQLILELTPAIDALRREADHPES